MKNQMNRRAVLAGSAVAALAAPALSRSAGAEDPVLPLYRRWAAGRIEWYRYADAPGNGNYDCPESEAAEKEVDEAYAAIIQTAPTTMAGIAALIVILWDLEGPGWKKDSAEYHAALEYPTNQLKALIWRGATGLDGYPPYGDLQGAYDFLPSGRVAHV